MTMNHTSQPNSILATAAAAKIWSLYGFDSSSDLDLNDLAFAQGVVVLEGQLDAADAWLVRKGERGIIRVSDTIPEYGRKRFAVAHELGHWLLHKSVSQLVSCTSEDMIARYKASAAEIEANIFAAELLMPRHLFEPAIRSSHPTAALVNKLAECFGTTRTSTAFRIADVTTDYFALVMSKNGIIKWWQASEAFREVAWLTVGSPVPRYSAAFDFFEDQTPPQGPLKVELEEWIPEHRGLEADFVYEDIIPMPSYGQVLSLIWLE
jgi:Zn-dependent peptidase ImmA (M78 family)